MDGLGGELAGLAIDKPRAETLLVEVNLQPHRGRHVPGPRRTVPRGFHPGICLCVAGLGPGQIPLIGDLSLYRDRLPGSLLGIWNRNPGTVGVNTRDNFLGGRGDGFPGPTGKPGARKGAFLLARNRKAQHEKGGHKENPAKGVNHGDHCNTENWFRDGQFRPIPDFCQVADCPPLLHETHEDRI